MCAIVHVVENHPMRADSYVLADRKNSLGFQQWKVLKNLELIVEVSFSRSNDAYKFNFFQPTCLFIQSPDGSHGKLKESLSTI